MLSDIRAKITRRAVRSKRPAGWKIVARFGRRREEWVRSTSGAPVRVQWQRDKALTRAPGSGEIRDYTGFASREWPGPKKCASARARVSRPVQVRPQTRVCGGDEYNSVSPYTRVVRWYSVFGDSFEDLFLENHTHTNTPIWHNRFQNSQHWNPYSKPCSF